MIALWGLLTVAKDKNINQIQISSDSHVIINWFRDLYNISSVILEPWQRKIRALKESFIDIEIQYISRAYNQMANSLSKVAL